MSRVHQIVDAHVGLSGPARVTAEQIIEALRALPEPSSNGVAAGQYGGGTKTLVLTFDEDGLSGVEVIDITGAPPSGVAAGVVEGPFSALTFRDDMATQAELDTAVAAAATALSAAVSSLTALIAAVKAPYPFSFSANTSFSIPTATHGRGTGTRAVIVTDASGNYIVADVNCAANGDVTITTGVSVAIKGAIF